MAEESATTNYLFKKSVARTNYKAEYDFNLDLLDGLLVALTKALSITSADPTATLTVTNTGAGVGMQVDSMNITAALTAATIKSTGDFEIIPSGEATDGIIFKINTGNATVEIDTARTNGFDVLDAFKVSNTMNVTGDLTVGKKIKTDAGFELFPDFDGNPTTKLEITVTGASLKLDTLGVTFNLETDVSMNLNAGAGISLFPKVVSDPTLKLGLQNNSGALEIFTSASDDMIITASGKLTLVSNGVTLFHSDDSISLFPDFDSNPANELKLSSIGGVLTLETAQTINYKSNGAFNIQADVGVSIHPKLGTDAGLNLTIQNNSGDLELSSGTDNLIITSSESFTLNSDNKFHLFPDKTVDPTAELEIARTGGDLIELKTVGTAGFLFNTTNSTDRHFWDIGNTVKMTLDENHMDFSVPIELILLASDPTSPTKGWVYYNTFDDTIRYFNGSIFKVIATV